MWVSNLGIFFSFRYAKICNKISYSCETWKYPEIYIKKKSMFVFAKKKRI